MEYYKNTSLVNIDTEIWKDVLGYEGMYKVSSFGRIKSLLKGEKILSQWFGGGGNLLVTLCADGNKNKQYVSNIVGCCFIGVPNRQKNEVFCHLNKIKTDNRVVNLSIETKSVSKLLNYHIGVEKDWGIKDVGVKTRFVSKYKYIGIDKEGNEKEYSYQDLLNKYGAGIRSIQRCIKGERNYKTAYKQTWKVVKL